MGASSLGSILSRPLACLALGAALVTAALAPHQAAAQAKKPTLIGIAVATLNSSYCMFPAAVRLGYFAEEGLDVRLQPIAGSTSVVQTLLSGRLEVGMPTPEPVFKGVSQGNDMVLIYNFIRKPTGSVAVLENSPIQKLEDLKNKKLGAQSLASGNIMLTNGILEKLGINTKTEVTYLSVGVGGQALQALRSGHVDGLILFDSLYAAMEQMGAKLRYFYGPGQEKLFSTQIAMRRSVVESDPEYVGAVGRSIAKASILLRDNPEACVKLMWQQVPSTRVAGQSEAEQLANDLAVAKKRMELIDPGSTPWGHYERDGVEAWNQFAVDGGIIDAKLPDIDKVYTNKFVPEYNKFDQAAFSRRVKELKP